MHNVKHTTLAIVATAALVLSGCSEGKNQSNEAIAGPITVLDDSVTSLSSTLVTGVDVTRQENFWRCSVSADNDEPNILALRFFRDSNGLIGTSKISWADNGNNSAKITLENDSILTLNNIEFSSKLQQNDNFTASDSFNKNLSCKWEGPEKRNIDGALADFAEQDLVELTSLLSTNNSNYWSCMVNDQNGNVSTLRLDLQSNGYAAYGNSDGNWYVFEDYELILSLTDRRYFFTNIYYPESDNDTATFRADERDNNVHCTLTNDA